MPNRGNKGEVRKKGGGGRGKEVTQQRKEERVSRPRQPTMEAPILHHPSSAFLEEGGGLRRKVRVMGGKGPYFKKEVNASTREMLIFQLPERVRGEESEKDAEGTSLLFYAETPGRALLRKTPHLSGIYHNSRRGRETQEE